MKQDKSITTILDISATREREIQKIKKFFTTKRGKVFVSKIHTASIKELCDRYDAPKCIRNIEKNKINLFSVLYTLNMADREYYRNGRYKYTIRKEPQINLFGGNKLEKTKQIKLTIKERKIYNKAHSPRKMGFAALMHALEEHKVNKFRATCDWIFKDSSIRGDLFSDEMLAQQNTQLSLYREYTRNFLAKAYSGVENREYFYRLFLVKENKSNLAEHKIYEVEGDPMVVGYPFTMCTENTSIDIIREILYSRAKTIRARGGELPLELKLYNKYGKLIATVKV